MKKYILIFTSLVLLYLSIRLYNINSSFPIEYYETKETTMNLFNINSSELRIITEYTTCTNCLIELSEYTKIANKQSNLTISLILLEDDTNLINDFKKQIGFTSNHVSTIDKINFDLNSNLFFKENIPSTQIHFVHNNLILYKIKVDSRYMTDKNQKQKLISKFLKQ